MNPDSTTPSAAADINPKLISSAAIDDVCHRFAADQPIRQSFPYRAVLHMDRRLPFLCVFRRDHGAAEGTERLVTSEAAYWYAPEGNRLARGQQRLITRLAETANEELGGYLILEVWADEDPGPRATDPESGEISLPQPRFCIQTRQPHRPEGTVATLKFGLQRIKVHRMRAEVDIQLQADNHPPGLKPLIPESVAQRLNCHVVGLKVRPIYCDRETREVYTDVLRTLRRGVARAFKKAFFVFALNRTNLRPMHYYALGRTTLPANVWEVDRQLAEVSGQFKFLLQCTPINAERARREFMANGQDRPPVFQYRPLGSDPLLMKRQLMRIPTEDIDDPQLAHVLRQTQDELDRQITMLSDVGTPRFLQGSLQVFGGVEPSLLQLAQRILKQLPRRDGNSTGRANLSARAFARMAEREIEHYRAQWPAFAAKALLQDDMYFGLLSTGGHLLIGRETTIPVHRAHALLQHEIGTHLVTYYNGLAQPLRLLKVGLAGYDGLQEGLAVLAEYLVGGLSSGRLRTLAARVVAIHQMVRGISFPDVYRQLTERFDFEPRVAYTITMRVFRGGGLTKDAVYLRGLVEILQYLARGGDIDTLFVGKIAADHVAIARELLLRNVLQPTPLRPRYLEDPAASRRLNQLRAGCSVLDLVGQPD